MAKKIFAVSLVLGLALAGAAFAAGPWDLSANSATGQKIVVTGNVSIDDSYHALLRSGGRAYELIVPPDLVSQSGVEEGSRITVEGYATESGAVGGIALVVTRATIHGRDYDLSQYRDPRGNARDGLVRGNRNRWDNGQGYGNDNSRGYGRDNRQYNNQDNRRYNGRGNGQDNRRYSGRGSDQGNGRDNGQDNRRHNGRGNGQGNGQGGGQGNGRDNSQDNRQYNGRGNDQGNDGQDSVQGT